jgi:hypothetical protein
MIIKRKILLLLAACCFALQLQAQRQRYKAPLGTVHETGFYEIAITPELSACLKADFADLRIADDKGQMVPYIIRNNRSVVTDPPVALLPVVENRIVDSGRSQIVIQNNTGKRIRTLLITAGNTAVMRRATLSGSNDNRNWYIIHNDIRLEPSFATGTANEYTQQATIPASNYAYLKLVVDNEHADPVHIISIGIPADKSVKPVAKYTYKENPPMQLLQKDSIDGNSYITLHNEKPYHTELLRIQAGGPRFYDREVAVRAPANDTTESCASCNEIARFHISSAGNNSVELNRFKSRVLQLVIENGDNPPVIVRSVTGLQRAYTVVAWLEKNKDYEILADDPAALRPQYDLEKFADSIPAQVRSLSFKKIEPVKKEQQPLLPDPGNGRRIWLWATILAVAVFLAVLTWRLLKDMRRKGM